MHATKTKTYKKRAIFSLLFVSGIALTLICLLVALFYQQMVLLYVLTLALLLVILGLGGYTLIYMKEKQQHNDTTPVWAEIMIDFMGLFAQLP